MLAKRLAIAIGLAALVAAPVTHAGEFKFPGLSEIPLPDPNDHCATPTVIQNLKRDVDHKFRGYTKTKLFLVEVINPVETHSRDRDETHTVQRKWCHAKARMNDAARGPVTVQVFARRTSVPSSSTPAQSARSVRSSTVPTS